MVTIEMNKTNKNEYASVFWSINLRHQQDSDVWLLISLHKSKIKHGDKEIETGNTDSFTVHVNLKDIYENCEVEKSVS